jgi:catalase
VLFDAVYIPGGKKSVGMLQENSKFLKFINEAFKHCKAIAVDNEGEHLLDKTYVADYKDDKGVLINKKPEDFVKAVAKHRQWDRMEKASGIPV